MAASRCALTKTSDGRHGSGRQRMNDDTLSPTRGLCEEIPRADAASAKHFATMPGVRLLLVAAIPPAITVIIVKATRELPVATVLTSQYPGSPAHARRRWRTRIKAADLTKRWKVLGHEFCPFAAALRNWEAGRVSHCLIRTKKPYADTLQSIIDNALECARLLLY